MVAAEDAVRKPSKPVVRVQQDARLPGLWRSDDTAGGSTPGYLEFSRDGRVALAPDFHPPVFGRYTAKDGWLDITISSSGENRAQMHYVFGNAGELTLEYENGMRQTFRRSNNKDRTVLK